MAAELWLLVVVLFNVCLSTSPTYATTVTELTKRAHHLCDELTFQKMAKNGTRGQLSRSFSPQTFHEKTQERESERENEHGSVVAAGRSPSKMRCETPGAVRKKKE